MRAGQTIVRRYLRAGHVTMALACRVLADDDRGLLLWVPVGAEFACRWHPDGTRLRETPVADIVAAELRAVAWADNDVLILMPPGQAHSVWWFYRAGEFRGWYVNLEEPARRWESAGVAGVDTVDQTLDIVVTPDRCWHFKDEDEFAFTIDTWGYWGRADAERIRAEGNRVIADIERGRFPFDGTWCARPPGSALGALGCPVPVLPAGLLPRWGRALPPAA